MIVHPYLSFDGRCEEAIEFYKQAVGAQVEMLMRFKEAPGEYQPPPGTEDKIMHSCLRIGDSQIMASDGYCAGNCKFDGISLSLKVTDEAEADKVFDALKEGGSVQMPLQKTFFSPKFGTLTDRFGVTWMVIVES